MSKQTVGIGAAANDGTGDPLRTAFNKLNDNFNEVYASIGDGTTLAPFKASDIDTFAELDAIVADAALVSADGVQTLTNKTLNAVNNDIHADTIREQVRNDSGATLNPLVPVYATGYNVGQELVTVDMAEADVPASMPCIGLTATSIANNSDGAIVTTGRLKDVDTSAFAVGDILYVSTTAGALTATRPVGGVAQPVAVVVRSHASLGVVFVIADLLAGLLGLSGSDPTSVTGTAGVSGNLVQWNADGDAVDSTLAVANVVEIGDDADTLGSGAATDGHVLTADGLGGAAWEAGGGSAAGADGQVQFALSGSFSADAGLAYNSTTKALTVGGATVTTDSPVLNLAQTWNAAGVAFTGLKLNVTDTASATTSLLMDLQVGVVSQEKTDKAGNKTLTGALTVGDNKKLILNSQFDTHIVAGGININFHSNTVLAVNITNAGSRLLSGGYYGWSSHSNNQALPDLYLYRDAANTMAQRNGVNPQTFRLANTWTNSSNLERLSIGWSANVCTIATEALGTGTKRNLVLDGANRAAYSETPADIAAALVAHGIMSPA